MPAKQRFKTQYPGVFYREAQRIGTKGTERVYYIVFKKAGKVLEEKVGRQFVDDMTAAKAARIRAQRIEGKRESRKETRERERAERTAQASRWTFDRLRDAYRANKPESKSWKVDANRYDLHLKDRFGDREPGDILPLDADRLRVTLLKKGKRPQTVKHVLTLLKRIVSFGVNKGLCPGLSFRPEMPRVSNVRIEDLTVNQLTRLLEELDK